MALHQHASGAPRPPQATVTPPPPPVGLPFQPADLDALDAANHAADLREEHDDGSWRDRD